MREKKEFRVAMAPPSTSNEGSLHAALLKRATERIDELEQQLAAAGGVASEVADVDVLRRLELRLRDQQAEIAQRVATMSDAYQQLVSQLRTMSVSLKELAALSTAFSEALDILGSASAEIGRSETTGFQLDVPSSRVESTPAAPPPSTEAIDPDSALAAAADSLLATLADVEASLDEALQDPATAAATARLEAENNADEDTPDQDAGEGSGKGSRYSRRSAKLPRLGETAQQEALATAKSMRTVFNAD